MMDIEAKRANLVTVLFSFKLAGLKSGLLIAQLFQTPPGAIRIAIV